jgi:hypothetical protein
LGLEVGLPIVRACFIVWLEGGLAVWVWEWDILPGGIQKQNKLGKRKKKGR